MMPTQTGTHSGTAQAHAAEVSAGERFSFGKNWRVFLEGVNDEKIDQAVVSLRKMLGVTSLEGKTFLDIGSGSGLFSLASFRMGAVVTSFDYDTDSVYCTQELRRRFGNVDRWTVMQGSVLDPDFMEALGSFDIVYSWGVLHHTGAMWDAIERAVARVSPGGTLFIALYNYQSAWTERWTRIKRLYCSGPLGRFAVISAFIPYWVARNLVADVVWLRNPFSRYSTYGKSRGMSVVRDWFDWLGGYPFEAATPESVILPIQKRGFELINLVTAGGSVGCVEYVFRRQLVRDSIPT